MPVEIQDMPATPSPGFVFDQVSWEDYEAMLRIVGDRPIRVTYDRGRMRVISPLWTRGSPAFLLGAMVSILVEEWNLSYEPADPVTFRRRDLEKGAEPDKCFHLGANTARIRGKREIQLPDDPPPDLVVEVDVTASSVERLPIFGALGIAEVWRFSNGVLEFLHLQPEATYRAEAHSLAFPRLAVADAERFLKEGLDADKTAWGRAFRAYVRDNLVDPPPGAQP
ncbi:MAG: Uma2 family endonuclease [Isosphaeraceae bacterium]